MHALKRYRSTILALALSALCLWLSVRAVDPTEVRAALASADWGWAVVAAVASTAVVTVRAFRWWLVYSASQSVPFRTVFSASTIALMVNAVLPFRGLSTILRAYLVRKNAGVPIVTSIGTITVERFWEVFSQAATIAVVLIAVDLPSWTTTGGGILLGVNLIMLCFLASLWAFPGPTALIAERVLGRFSQRAATASLGHLAAFREGLAALGRPGILAGMTACTLFIAVAQGMVVWFGMRAFDLDVPFAVAWALYIGVTLGLALPSAPAGIGTFQFVVMSILGWFGVAESEAVTASFVIQAALLGPPIVIGLICLAFEGISFGSLAGRSGMRETLEPPVRSPVHAVPQPVTAEADRLHAQR